MDVVDAEHVGQEQSIEQPALEQAGEVHPVLETGVFGGAVAWVPPQALLDVADAVHIESVEADLFHARASRTGTLTDSSHKQ